MGFALALAQSVSTQFPRLAVQVGTAIAVAATILGLDQALGLSLDTRPRTSGMNRILADTYIIEAFVQVLDSPVGISAVAAEGVDPALVKGELVAELNADIQVNIPPEAYPAFDTAQQLDGWFFFFQALYSKGLISIDRMVRTVNWRNTELERLAAAPVVTPTITTELITGLLPGQTGVRITTTGITPGVALQAPINVTLPPISLNPNIQVNVPPFVIAPPTVITQPIPAPQVVVPVNVETGLLGTIIAGALPAVGATFAQAMSASAGPNAHAAQQARYACQGSFFGSIAQVVSTVGLGIIAGSTLLFDNPVKAALDKKIAEFMAKMLDPKRFVVATTYEGAVANASDRLTEAIGFGTAAQAMAYAFEAMSPLKTFGFNQLAGFLGDLAGFKRIADGLMGTVESAAIYQPLRWEANRRFRPTLPSESMLSVLYAKRLISAEYYQDVLARQGLPDQVVSLLPGDAFRQLTQGDLAVLLRNVDLTDAEITRRLELDRTDPGDIALQRLSTRLEAVSREQRTRYTQVALLYRDGFIDSVRARQEIAAARTPAPYVDYRMAAMELQREYDVLADTRSIVLQAMSRGVVTRDMARADLVALGMGPIRADMEVVKATLGMIPGRRVQLASPEELADELAAEAA
mgnify:FL=1